MWIEVQRKNKKIPSPIASPNLDIKSKRPSPLRPLNACSGSKSADEIRKRIRPPPGFPELENIEPTIRPREPEFWTHRTTEKIVNWRDEDAFPELMRLQVPLKAYNGDPISIPDDIPLRDNPISITTQLATLEPIRNAIQEMAKENEKKRQRKIRKCSKILECELEIVKSKSEMISTLAGLTEISLETGSSTDQDSSCPQKPISGKIHPGVEICESLLSEPEDDQIDGDDFVGRASFTPPKTPISPPSRSPIPAQKTLKHSAPLILLNVNAAVFRPIVKKTQHQKQNIINAALFPPLVHYVPFFWYR